MDENNNISITQISENLSMLMDFLRSNNPLMLVVGEKESGKSRLLSTVIAKMRVARHIIRIKGSDRVSAAEVIKLFAKNWSAPIENNEDRLDKQLTTILHSIIEHEHACVLVIDDAHLLPFSVLGAILHLAILQEQQKVYLHLILSGTLELEEKIRCIWPHEITKLTLGKLSREQVYEDIKERLAAQQYMPAPSLLERIVNRIYEQSNGLPESVNRMVNTLIGQFPTKQPIKKMNRPIARKRMVRSFSLMSLLIFGMFIWWFYQTPYQTVDKPNTNLAQTQQKVKHTAAPIIGQVILQPKANQELQTWIAAATPIEPAPTNLLASPKIYHAKEKEFVLQLMGSKHPSALKQYAHEHHLEKITDIIHTHYKNNDWYILAYGHYKTAKQAKTAYSALPNPIKKLHPWVRPVDETHFTSFPKTTTI